MGSWRRSNKISMKCGWRVGRSPLPVFYHTFCTLGAFRLRETSYRELKPCKLQWFLHLRVVKIVRKIAKVKKFTKIVPVRAGKLSTTPFCTEFRCESNRADGMPNPLFCKFSEQKTDPTVGFAPKFCAKWCGRELLSSHGDHFRDHFEFCKRMAHTSRFVRVILAQGPC